MQERFSRPRVGGLEGGPGGRGLEKIFIEITLLLESLQATAQVGDGVANAVQFLGVHLEGFTGELKWSPPYRNDPADGGDEDQDDDELENTHFGNPLGDPWLLHRCDTPDFPARAIGETSVT